MYDQVSLDAAWDLVKDWTAEERQALRDAVPRTGLGTPFRNTRVLEIARAAHEIAKAGLARRGMVDSQGHDETRFLTPVEEILREGLSPAQEMLERYEGAWAGRVTPLYREYAF